MNTNVEPLGAASSWIIGLVGGSVATALCVIAIAAVGYQLLSGKLVPLRAAQVFLGAFVLLGSATIASALIRGSGFQTRIVQNSPIMLKPTSSPVQQDTLLPERALDPYAGASAPSR